MELIDPNRFYPTNRHAAAAFREETTGERDRPESSGEGSSASLKTVPGATTRGQSVQSRRLA